jgi:hypothetical protein
MPKTLKSSQQRYAPWKWQNRNARQISGTRQARWLKISNATGQLTRIIVNGFIDRDKNISKEVRILSQVLGRSEKGRLNDKNYRVLPDRAYSSRLIITE